MAGNKFKELVHFMIHECREDPASLGAVRLNKALWFTDLDAYMKRGESITGARYVKRRRGPAPSAIVPVLRGLVEEGAINIEEPEFMYEPRLYLSLREPECNELTQDDRKAAQHALGFVRNYSAFDLSEITHEEIWEAASEGEEIPLYAMLASGTGEITDEVLAWADNCIREIEQAETV